MTPPTGSAKLPPPYAPKSDARSSGPTPPKAAGASLKIAPQAPVDTVVIGAKQGAKTNPTDAAKAIAPSAPAGEESFNPTKLMRQVDEGDVIMKLPVNAGSYGSGTESFTVPQGLIIRIHARVRDGRLVPGITKIDFVDKNGKNLTLDNMLWVETRAFELTPDGKVMARLSGFPDQEITRSMLGIDDLPLDMPGLYDTITTRAKEMEKSAAKFTSGSAGPLFDPNAYGLELTNCVIAPGAFPLPDPSVKLDIGGERPPPQLLAQKIHDASERGDFAALKGLLEDANKLAAKGEILPAEVYTLLNETLPLVIEKADKENDLKWWEIILLILSFFTLVGGALWFIVDASVEWDHEASLRLAKELREQAKKLPNAPQDHKGRTVLTMTANARRMHIEGQFELRSVGVDRAEATLKGKKTSAKGTIDVDFVDAKPTILSIKLDDVKVQADCVHLEDGKGSVVNLGASSVSGGEVSIGFDIQKGEPTGAPVIKCGHLDTTIGDTTLMIPGIGDELTALKVKEGKVQGRVGIDDSGNITVDVEAVKVKASVDKIETGEGAFKINYATANIEGTGRLTYLDGDAKFTGDVSLTGTVDDGRVGVPGGMFNADIAAGAQVDLKLSALGFGKKGVDFSASGHLEVGLDSGSIMLASGTRFSVTRGAKAIIDVREVTHLDGKTTFKGSIELEGNVGADFNPKALSGAGISFTEVKGVSGRLKVKLDDVDMQADGGLTIKGIKTNASVVVTKISGKLDASVLPKTTSSSKPKIALAAPPKMKVIGSATAVTAPDPADLIGKIDGAIVSVKIPLPGYKATGIEVHPLTTMKITAVASGGKLDYSSFRISFSPEIDLPGPLGGKGFYLESDGSIIADIDWLPDVNISRLIGGLKMPSKLTSLFSTATTIARLGSTAVGSGSSMPSLDDLSKLGITVDLANVSLDGRKLNLGSGGDVTIDPASNVNITFGTMVVGATEHGVLRMSADVDLTEANFSTPESEVEGMKGRANIALKVVGDGADRVSVAKVTGTFAASGLAVATPDALVTMSNAMITGGVTLSQLGTAKPTLSASLTTVAGTLGDSQINVTRDGKTAAVMIKGGTSFLGSVSIDGKTKRLGADLAVSGLSVTTGAVDLGMRGFEMKVNDVAATASGRLKIGVDGVAKTTAISLDGDVRASVKVPEGGFGSAKTSFAFQFGEAVSAALALDHLELGDTPSGTSVLVAGSTRKDGTRAASLKVKIKSGHLVLPTGIKLAMLPGTEGDIQIASFKREAKDAFASVRGKLTVRAKTASYVPKEGVELATGVRLMKVEGSQGEVVLVIDDFQVDGDGQFRLNATTLTADVTAKQVDARLDIEKLLTTVMP